MSEKDKANLLSVLEACEKINAFTREIFDADDFYNDKKSFDAVLMNFVVIGESVKKLSTKVKSDNPQIPWQKIKGFRNIVAHDYFGVDAEEVWQIVQQNIPELMVDIEEVLKN